VGLKLIGMVCVAPGATGPKRLPVTLYVGVDTEDQLPLRTPLPTFLMVRVAGVV
jgi:hypothetical protein